MAIRRRDYRKFTSASEARKWLEQQSEWMKCSKIDDETVGVITEYTGGANVQINNYLRFHNLEFDLDEEKELINKIKTLADVIRQCILSEKIVVYRYTHYKTVELFCKGKEIKRGAQYTDPAFLSTTLCPKELKHFCKNHSCNCRMKIYLDKGSTGLAISSISDPNNMDEMELILPPDSKLEILRVHRLFRSWWLECKWLSDGK